jgi:acyl-coenzyme A thioesterase PaaI-like protein
MSLLPVYDKSFFMGKNRPDGLQLKMRYRKGIVYSDINVSKAFEGYEGVVHGGILFGILDVLMWYVIFLEGRKICMTRKTDMDFLKPVLCGTPYRAQARMLRIEDRDVWATGWIEGPDKERHAQVTALFREAKGATYKDLVGRMDFTDVSPEMKRLILEPITERVDL